MRLPPNFFHIKSYVPRKSQSFDFWRFLEIFALFWASFLNLRFGVQSSLKVVWIILAYTLFHKKAAMVLGNVIFLDLCCQIWYHRFNQNNWLLKANLHNKQVLAFKQVIVLKLWQFFRNFLALRENYRANSQVVFNREAWLSESSLFKWPQKVIGNLFAVFFLNILNFLKIFTKKIWDEKFIWKNRLQ